MNLEKQEALEEALEGIVEDYGKWTKEECHYVAPSTQPAQCSNCYFYKEGGCEIVDGEVAAEAYCRFWVTSAVEKQEEDTSEEEEYSLTSDEDLRVAQELSKVMLSENAFLFTPLDSVRAVAKKLYKDSSNKQLLSQLIEGSQVSKSQVEEMSSIPHPVFQAFSNRIINFINKDMTTRQKRKEAPALLEPMSSIEVLSNGIARIPVAKLGEWKHDAYGKVKFTEQDFEDITRNFNERVLGFNPYATYGHLKTQEVETIDAELKKGEPVGFERDGDVLYALTQPKEDALNLIQNGEYEYASGEFIRNYKDKETGEDKGTVLIRYALTNSPFLPFGDNKIELLSNSSSGVSNDGSDNAHVLQSPSTFVIKLTSSSGEISTTNTLDETTMQIETTSAEKAPEVSSTPAAVEVVEATQEQPTQALQVTVENPGSVTSTAAAPAVQAAAPQAPASLDVNSLITQIKSVYETQMEALKQQAEATANSLKSEIENLKSRLDQQTQVTQAFSNSLSAQQKQQRYSQIAAQGVPPVLIEKLSQIESALDTGSKVIKLSNSAGESVESSIADSIKDLLISALNSEPVQFEQLGQTVSLASASGLNAELTRLIEQNKAAATKTK